MTLEVTADEAARIAVATRLGRLSLAVRSADEGGAATPSAPVPTIWGGDVSPALARPTTHPGKDAGTTLRLFQGAADGKEFRF